MKRQFHYDDSPPARERPLQLDEVEALILNGGQVLVDKPGRIPHFLGRVAASLRDHRERLARLQADVDRIRVDKDRQRQPVVRAMDALNALDAQQQRQLLDANYLAEMDRLATAREQAELAKAAARNDLSRTQLVLAELAADEQLDAAARTRVAAALRRIGSSADGAT